jgi:hypothetical protein
MSDEEGKFTYEDALRINPNMTPVLWDTINAAIVETDRLDNCELAFSAFKTARGFQGYQFFDRSGVTCNIQDSSLATAPAIWLGCASDDVSYMTSKGWETKPLREMLPGVDSPIVSTRMHLTNTQVASLIPVLQHFVDEGYLPDTISNVKASMAMGIQNIIDDLQLLQKEQSWAK